MTIYWACCFLSMFLFDFMYNKVKYTKWTRWIPVVIGGMPLFLLSALRYGIGTDYNTYVSMYETYFSKGIRGEIEPLFYTLNKLISDIGLDVQWVFVVCSAIFVFVVFWYVMSESKDVKLSIFLLVGMTYYMSSFNTMRQYVAFAMCLIALKYAKNQKRILFLFFVILATGIHYSSIVFLVVYLFNYIKIKPSRAILYTAIFVCVIPLITSIIKFILSATKYAKYFVGLSFSVTSLFGIAMQATILIFASLYYDNKDRDYNIYYCLQLAATWLTILGNSVPLIGRVRWLFGLPSIVLVPLVLSKIKDGKMKLFFEVIIYLLFFVYAQIIVGIMGSYDVVPYNSIFDN